MRLPARTFAIAVVLSIVMVACGGTDDPVGTDTPATDGAASQALLRAASQDLSEQPIEATFTMSFGQGAESFSFDGEMTIDPATERAHMTYSFADVPGAPEDASMEMIVDGSTIYLRGAFLPDAGWIRVDADAEGLEGLAVGSGSSDPSAFLDYLRGADDVQVVGAEQVNGVDTTHFRGTLDLGEIVEQAPAEARRDAREAIEQLEAELGDLTTGFEAWVDGDGIPRRVRFSFEPQAGEGSFEIEMEIVRIGGDVEITVPPKSQVTDLGALGLPVPA